MRARSLVTDYSGRPVLRTVAIVVESRSKERARRALEEGTLLVGTHADCDVVIEDERASRRHCEIQLLDDGLRVRDLGSTNGTWVNDVRIEVAYVAVGATILIGGTRIHVEAEDEAAPLNDGEGLSDLTSKSPAMRAVLSLLGKVARAEATILLEGETGVGKDVLARAIHAASKRAKAPFVVVDCGTLTAALAGSELFGHKRGAFTGALADRAGAFEEAKGGTVFLDEVGELPLELQPTLLRVLEAREVKRVGENLPRKLDVRVVAATNRDLLSASEAGRFRADLFYRLAVVRVRVPPLRERAEDVPDLAARLLTSLGRSSDDVARADLKRLARHAWPGNVRELKNVLEQAAAVAAGGPLAIDLSPATVVAPPAAPSARAPEPAAPAPVPGVGYKEARQGAMQQFERGYVVELLRRHDGNVTQAAREAGVDRNYLYRLIKRYDIGAGERGGP